MRIRFEPGAPFVEVVRERGGVDDIDGEEDAEEALDEPAVVGTELGYSAS